MTTDDFSTVMVPMRDGIRLATDIRLPEVTPAPVILVRTPYDKNAPEDTRMVPARQALIDAGYAVVWQDVRGRYASEGEFHPFVADPEDGPETIRWIMEQEWSSGRISAYGASYLGTVQWSSAASRPDGLVALVPMFASNDPYAAPWGGEGGAFSWGLGLTWTVMQSELPSLSAIEEIMELAGRAGDGIDRLPMADQPGLAEKAPWWPDWMAHPDRDEYWTSMAASEHTENIVTPALHIGGWFDMYVNNTVNTYCAVRERAATAEAREGQRLLIGPWDHMDATGVYPHRDLGPDASSDAAGVVDAHMRFYDRHLRGDESALDGEAPVRIFVMGDNRWRDEAEWPLTDTKYTDFFLDGAGALTRTSPTVDVVEEYVYDPMNPAPTKGGRMLDLAVTLGCGPVDQAEVAQRDDVLVFTSPVLTEPVEVTGHVSAVLHVASSAVDTDFTGKLVDIDPDGRATYLTDGILRMRYRDSLEKPELITPGEVYEISVDMSVTSNVFLPGHRIGLEVSSSNFPRFVRNTNTGGRIVDDVEVVVATNRILHGPTHPSRLVLPIIDRR